MADDTGNNIGPIASSPAGGEEAADTVPRVGKRLRDARRKKNLTLAQVTMVSGLSKGFISDVERDTTVPSLASLLKLCRVLDVSVGDLLDARSASLVRADSRPRALLGGTGIVDYLLSGKESGIEVLETHVEPGGSPGKERYGFTARIEFMYVLEGSLSLDFDNELIELNAGDALTFPASRQHTWENASTTAPARVLVVIA